MYIVAKGHSFCTTRGILSPGDEITEKDFEKKETFLKKVTQGRIITGKSKALLEKEAAEAKAIADKEAAEAETKRLEQAKKDAVLNVETAEAALKKAKVLHSTAQEVANKLSGEIAAKIKPHVDELEKKIQDGERAVKEAVTALEKAKPENKEASQNQLNLAEEAHKSLLDELEKVKLGAETPEFKKALEEVDRAAEGIIDAEANLAEAKDAVARVV